MRYNELNTKFEDLRASNFNAGYAEVGVTMLIKRVFANYLGVSDELFIADDSFIQPCVPYRDKTEISGWSYVSLYAYDNNDKQIKLVLDFEKIKIPREILNSAPDDIKVMLPTEITNGNSQDLSRVFDYIKSKPEYSDFGIKLSEFDRAYSLKQYHFDSVTNNGYFIFYLGICFAESENSVPKNIRTIKLGITLHKNNIVELAIFDAEAEFEKICFLLDSKKIGLFNLLLLNNDEEKIKQYLEQLNKSKEYWYTDAKSIKDFITSNDIYKNLYSIHSKEMDFYPNFRTGDSSTKEKKSVEYIQFDVSNIKSWVELINSDDFQKAAHLMPDEVLERIFIRYKWFMEKDYNYYYKQINSIKDKAYFEGSSKIMNIHQPNYIYATNSTANVEQNRKGDNQINNATNSTGVVQSNKKTNLRFNVAIKKLAPSIFGSAIGTGIILNISKLNIVFKHIYSTLVKI
jgi:hypothetical protein